jgi:hypothetical protein
MVAMTALPIAFDVVGDETKNIMLNAAIVNMHPVVPQMNSGRLPIRSIENIHAKVQMNSVPFTTIPPI